MWQTSTRLLQLLAMLQARRDWSGQDLASRLAVSTRTIRTDIERLRELGYPVDATPGVGGGYRLGQGTTMPPLLLDDEEVVAVAIGLRTSTGSGVTGIEEASLRALVKLEQLMPSRLRHRIDAMRAATVSVPGTGPTVDSEVLGALASTIRASERLRFSYIDHDGNQTVRTAEPERLVAWGRRWYLLAWDVDRNDWRIFRAALALSHGRSPTMRRPGMCSAPPALRPGGIAPEFASMRQLIRCGRSCLWQCRFRRTDPIAASSRWALTLRTNLRSTSGCWTPTS